MNTKRKSKVIATILMIGIIVISLFINLADDNTIDTSDYVLLSSLTSSPLWEDVDLLVPKDTYIPSREEVSKTYSGLYSDTIIASLVNTDIIIQTYGIAITDDINLDSFKEQIVSGLSASRPEIVFNTSRVIEKGNLKIPTIEFLTVYDDHEIYSFIALVNVNGQFVTVTVNSGDYWEDASSFFNTLLENMVLK